MTRRPRKQQTQLAFSPVASSSPAASSYHQQIRDRAANMRYEGSPRAVKRRRVQDAPGLGDYLGNGKPRDSQTLPTPEASRDFAGNVVTRHGMGDDDSEPISSLPTKSSRKRTRQQTLNFSSPAPSAMTASSQVTTRSSQPHKSYTPAKPSFFGSQRMKQSKRKAVDYDSEDDLEDTIVLSNNVSHSQGAPVGLRGSKNSETAISQFTRSSASKRGSSSGSATPPRRASENFIDLGLEDSETDPDDVPVTPARRRRNNVGHRASSPVALEADGDDSDVVMTGRSRRSQKASSPVEDLGQDEQDESEEEVPRSRRRLRRPIDYETDESGPEDIVELSSGTEDEDSATPRKQRKEARLREEQQELEDDLLDLESGSEGEAEIRAAKKPQLSARAKALEKLKQKRTGVETIEIDDDEEEPEDEFPRSSISFAEHMKPDENDEDFLTDEGDDTLGAPDGIPIEFTQYASMKAKELFKFAVEWMVQKKLNPAFQINDEIYTLTFKKLDDEVKGLAGSKFTSAAWTGKFSFALRARPQIALERMDRSGMESFIHGKCDACNRSGHPATWTMQFQGRPYHTETLEEVESPDSDSDSDDSSNDDTERPYNRDAEGREIAPEDTTWYVGKFCMANAETAHALNHWRYHLYEWIVDWLQREGHLAPEKIVQRDKWSESKRRRRANKIVDSMIEAGKVGELYRDFKSQIDQARESKQGRFDTSP